MLLAEAQKFKIAERTLNLFIWVLTRNNRAALNMDAVYGQTQKHCVVLPLTARAKALKVSPTEKYLTSDVWEFFLKNKNMKYKISRVPKKNG